MIASNKQAALCALLAATATCGLTPQAATAQNTGPQKEYYLDEGEVDLYGGIYRYSNVDLVAGPAGEGGLTLIRYGNARDSGTGSVGATSAHGLDAFVWRESYREDAAGATQNSYYFHVTYGRTKDTFTWDRYGSPGTVLKNPDGATLTVTNHEHPTAVSYRSSDGTVVEFTPIDVVSGCASYGLFCAVAAKAVSPNGATTRFAYDVVSGRRRLRQVSNSYGFGIGFDYNEAANPLLITRACALNLSLAHAAVGAPCPPDAPAAAYEYLNGNLHRYTDAAGQATTYGYGTSGLDLRIRWPGSSSDDIVVVYNPTSRRVQSRSNAQNETWTYAYQLNEPFETANTTHNEWTEVTSPAGHKTLHKFNAGAPKPFEIRDAVGRTSQFFYTGPDLEHLGRRIDPEGNETRHTYDIRGNRTSTTLVAKPDSSLADIVTTAKFPETCANPVTCNKPEWVRDARGGQTVFTYDAVHGGVETEILPAVGGVQPKKTYIYGTRHAHYWKDDGTFGAGDPVQVLVGQHECVKAEGCASAAEEVHVGYDWGSGAGPLLLRGKVVDPGGLNLRTCYAYDPRGNRIAETAPKGNAGQASCP